MTVGEWKKTTRIGRVWHCGDEYCDCVQAQIEDVGPNVVAGFPWVKRNVVWQGTFHTEAWSEPWKDDNQPSPKQELEAALKIYGGTKL